MRIFMLAAVTAAVSVGGLTMPSASAQTEQVPLSGSAATAIESSSPLPPTTETGTNGPVVRQVDTPTTSSSDSAAVVLPPQTEAPAPPVTTVDVTQPAAPARSVVVNDNPAPSAAPRRARKARAQVGDLTSALLAAQADPNRVAPNLPMLGVEATMSWDRYMASFKQPIPQWFRTQVQGSSGSSSGSSN